MKSRIGKAYVKVSYDGACVDCGTNHSYAWEHAKTIDVAIGSRKGTIKLSRCGDCASIPLVDEGQAIPIALPEGDPDAVPA